MRPEDGELEELDLEECEYLFGENPDSDARVPTSYSNYLKDMQRYQSMMKVFEDAKNDAQFEEEMKASQKDVNGEQGKAKCGCRGGHGRGQGFL